MGYSCKNNNDFKPEELSIETENDESSKTVVHQVR